MWQNPAVNKKITWNLVSFDYYKGRFLLTAQSLTA